MASDDVKYNAAKDETRREWTLLSKGTGGLRQQGMYAMTSSGIPLGYLNAGWPDPDPLGVLAKMKEAVARYQGIPRSDRILRVPLVWERDALQFEEYKFRKPPGTLNLRVSSRGLPFEGMTTFDQRHPMFFHVDRLWFKPSEWRSFIPDRVAVGASTEVTGPARTRIVLLSHHQAGYSAWWEEHIAGGRTTSRITKIEGNRLHLVIEGDYRMRADSQWCKDSYDGNLIAKAVFDRSQNAFTRFDLAMLGTHTIGQRMENLHAGSLTSRIAASAELNPLRNSADRMIPKNWRYGYSLRWAATP